MPPVNKTSPELEAQIIADMHAGLGRKAVQRKYGIGGSTVSRIKALCIANRDTKFDIMPDRIVGKVTEDKSRPFFGQRIACTFLRYAA